MRNIPSGWESRVVPTPSSSPGPTFSFLKRNVPLKKFMEVFLILHRYFRRKKTPYVAQVIILYLVDVTKVPKEYYPVE